MANADGKLFNADRWTIYTLQRLFPNKRFKGHYRYGWGDHIQVTPSQRRRMVKKMRKNRDYSIGVY